MALITAGLDFSTLAMDGANLALCTTVNTTPGSTATLEYPMQSMQLGTRTNGSDNSEYIYCQTAGAYAIGTAGQISNDGTWTFTALTTTTAATDGSMVGVMSQCPSVTVTPTAYLYDCVWVQISGGCPGVRLAGTAAINVVLYTTTSAGVLHSVSATSASLITGIVSTTSNASAVTAVEPAVLQYPQVSLT